jgi:hypothetical protein
MSTSKVETEKYDFTPSGTGLIARGILNGFPPPSLSIDCETIILNKRDLEISFKLDPAKIKNFDRIIINGITFVREKTDE